jgi:hypothetical protein
MDGYVGRVKLSGSASAGGPGSALTSFPSSGQGDATSSQGNIPQGRASALGLGMSALGNGTLADSVSSFPGFSYERKAETSFTNDMLRGNWEHTPLSDGYFSQKNMDTIQNNIRRIVYDKSQPKGYVIDDQSADELKIIMRAMFYQYSKNHPHDIPGQIADLNQKVADWCVPHIMSAVDHYIYYLKDIDTLPVPLARSVNISKAGTKTLPFNTFM